MAWQHRYGPLSVLGPILLVAFTAAAPICASGQPGGRPLPDPCTLEGRVFEVVSRGDSLVERPLPGAHIAFLGTGLVTVADQDGGFHRPGLSCGEIAVKVSHVGFVSLDSTLRLPAGDPVRFGLQAEAGLLEEITVSARAQTVLGESAPASTIDVAALPIEEIPTLLGEPDLIRAIQNLPGVKTQSDFSGQFYVRGGRADQNLVLLDGAPVFSPWHLFGLFSPFNTEALHRVELAKGVLPPRYGGRLSSLLDVELEDGSRREGADHLNVSILSATGSYGGRLSDQTSYMVAARRTYMDPVLWFADRALSTSKEETRTRYRFTDLNAKLTHHLQSGGAHHTIMLGAFFGHDRFQFKVTDREARDLDSEHSSALDVGWQNLTGTVRLESEGQQWSLRHQAYTTQYASRNRLLDASREAEAGLPGAWTDYTDEARFRQRLSDWGYRLDGMADLSHLVQGRAGLAITRHAFRDESGVIETRVRMEDGGRRIQESDEVGADRMRSAAWNLAAHLGLRLRLGQLSVFPGFRTEAYHANDGRAFFSALPRLTVTVVAHRQLTLSAGYGRNVQYFHVLGNDLLALPTDRWFWTGASAPPSRGEIYTVGGVWISGSGHLVSVEAYYKRSWGLRTFSPVAIREAFETTDFPLFGSHTIGDGTGRAYGVEFFYQKSVGRWTGWVGYTWSRSLRQFESLNYGRVYPARIDRPHDLQVACTFELSTRWRVGTAFNLKSGQPMTLPSSGYLPVEDPLGLGLPSLAAPLVYTSKNGYRLPVYHRLDISVTHATHLSAHPAELTLSVVNAYNRMNPFIVVSDTRLARDGGGVVVRPRHRSISQLPILPMLSVRIDLKRETG